MKKQLTALELAATILMEESQNGGPGRVTAETLKRAEGYVKARAREHANP